MQKLLPFILAAILLLPVSGCASPAAEPEAAPPMVQIANPWKDWTSLEEAEQAVGFSFGLPDKINDRYTAHTFRTMNNTLLEVVYGDGESKVWVRKQKGEGQDISGDYNKYDTCTEQSCNGAAVTTYHNAENNAVKQLVSYNGYSWSLVAPNGYWGDSNREFISEILG